jgi:RNA polymerase sigma-70 factor (ECF subfamily)
MAPTTQGPGPSWTDAEGTLHLLTAARAGDAEALERLFGRYLPSLHRWARGRLPGWARDISDTHDLVQETVVQVFTKLDGFEYRGEGALLADLRQALESYDAALARLCPEERELIIARVELELTYQEVAAALGKPSADAARMAVARALVRLSEEMNRA